MSVEADGSSPLSEGQSAQSISKSSPETSDGKNDDFVRGQGDKSEPGTPKLHPMAFTVDFGEAKAIDNRRLEELAKKSQARHQRVQSMSASLTRPSPTAQKPPLSAKLPRKAQGYNSEGYFSSDQEDSGLSGSVKVRSSPLAQNSDKPQKSQVTSPINYRQIKSPISDSFPSKRLSKSPIVDSIMSRSDNFTNRQGLNLPLKNINSSYAKNVHRTPSYGNLSGYTPKLNCMADIIDQSPEGIMLTDISSPELDILTPDNGLASPSVKSPVRINRRASSETPDLFKKCPLEVESLYIDDDNQSNNSSTGTYTIEGDNYTEEQKARMSIDRERNFGTNLLTESIEKTLKLTNTEQDPELIFDFSNPLKVITREPKKDGTLHSPLLPNNVMVPPKSSKDKNVLEISCCYESPTEIDLATQTSKQIKSTRSYLEKIKNRVRTITEKTFAKSPPRIDDEVDIGSFTSVTTSGVLSSKFLYKPEKARRRRSLTKSEIDQTDYVHRLSRESSVPVSLMNNKPLLIETNFESTVLRNAHKALRDDEGVPSELSPNEVVGKLSYLSLNRCKGDKTWIQDWADSVKKYNHNTLATKETNVNSTFNIEDRPPLSPRHLQGKSRSPRSQTPTKIPSPVGTLLSRRTPDLIPQQETESYLLKTQNAITNLQAKLQSSRTNFSTIPPQLTSSLMSDKTQASRLPVSQLSRSNSLNYRLRSRDNSGESSPLRSPGQYVITGSTKLPESTRKLLTNTSKSLDTEHRKKLDSNMNSPSSDRGLLSNSSDDRTVSNRPQFDVQAILSPHRKSHSRHKSFDGRNPSDYFTNDAVNNQANQVCLKTVLKNNVEAKGYAIDQTRCLDTKKHHRVLSDTPKQFKPLYNSNSSPFGTSIKRSSSFNTVNRNNNYLDPRQTSRRASNQSEKYKDYLSDESDEVEQFDKSQEMKHKRQLIRGRIDSPDLKSVPLNSPRCPNTPELHRKFGPGLVRNSVRVTNKERNVNSRMSEPPMSRDERGKPASHQSRRISEPTRQAVLNRLTKSRSSTREFQPKAPERGQKKPSQHRSSSALASKEIEFSNWKKRSSYDPMKAAQEGRKKQVMAKRQECNKDDLSSPSHSSPVHRSQSFHTTTLLDLESQESSEDEHQLPADVMITSTHSDILDCSRAKRREAMINDVVLAKEYFTSFKINQPSEKLTRRSDEKRKTFIIDDITPTKDNIDFLPKREDTVIDKRKTFILDSDTNSTTNGSSPRNSSIFSHEKNSLTTCTSDTEGESGTESAPVVLRHPGGRKGTNVQPKQRYSGDYSMSSSAASISQQPQLRKAKEPVLPRYMDISKYKSETSSNFLRRDPSRTYVVPHSERQHHQVSKGSAQHYEMEQKKQELEKWKRRASYDPRKAAAQGRGGKPPPKTASSVLRSQSFHGPVLVSSTGRYAPPSQITENYDANSDNDF